MITNDNHVIIGIGGTGGNILKAIRKRYFLEVPSAAERRNTPLGFVYVDSSEENMKPNDPTWKVLGENTQLGKDSFLFLRGASLADQLANVDIYPGIKHWLGDREIWHHLVGMATDGVAAQRRRIGRFLFACSVNEYEATLKNQVKGVRAKSGITDVTFHIITGLAGGTGSGSLIDVIAQTRKHFCPVNAHLRYRIIVYCILPEEYPKPMRDKGFYHANGFAALQELNALEVKRLIPHDVSGEHEFVPLDDVPHVFDSCFLFTNTNENGITVDTAHALPEIVSDLIFHYVSLPVNEVTRAFHDEYTLYLHGDRDAEVSEQARDWEAAVHEKPVRTCRFNACGIKRIINPEEEITEYFTYSFARQAILQFKYNNWSDDLGYLDQPRNEDYITFVNDRATLNAWMLSDAHLMLSLPILPSEKDQKWKTFPEDWNAIMPNLANVAWEKESSRAINELSRLCEEHFERNFRKTGVPEFYKIKEQACEDIAKEVVQTIERDLFSQWQIGQKSVYEIGRLMDMLVSQSEKRLDAFDEKIVSRAEEIEELLGAQKQNELAWADMGIISIVLSKKKKLYQAQTTLLQQLYIRKTEWEGLRFGKKLLAEIINELQLLNSEIRRFSGKLTTALNVCDKELAARCREGEITQETFMETVVKYYDTQEVKRFVKRVTHDEHIQSPQCSAIRYAMAELAGMEKTFTCLNEEASADCLMDIFSKKSRESSVIAHNQLLVSKKQRLIGINLVEKLKARYGTPDRQTELDDFVRQVMDYSGVFLTFNQGEIIRQLKNNAPPRPGLNTLMGSMLVNIPESPENKDFVDKLTDSFRRNAGRNRAIYVDTKSQRKNEITVINLISGFPLRMVNEVGMLKEKYDAVLRGNNPEVARLVLHLEGEGSQYANGEKANGASGNNRTVQS